MRQVVLGAVLAVVVLGENNRLLACPDCNIYNFLAESVCASKNIIIGKVIEPLENHEAKVEVIKILRGRYNVGQVVEMDLRAVWESIGKTFLFSDPTGVGPDFPTLSVSFEDEVRFLMQFGYREVPDLPMDGTVDVDLMRKLKISLQRPYIQNVDEAIRRAQDCSNQSRYLAMEYLFALKTPPTDKIIEALELQLKRGPEAGHEVRCLAAVLLLKPDTKAREYAVQQVRAFATGKQEPVDWAKIPAGPTTKGTLVTALVGCSGNKWYGLPAARFWYPKQKKPDDRLLAEQKKTLLESYPTLGDFALADVTFALCDTDTCKPEELLALLKDRKDKNGFALGMYFLGNSHAGVWANEQAIAAWTTALEHATRVELQKEIEEELAGMRKLWKAPK